MRGSSNGSRRSLQGGCSRPDPRVRQLQAFPRPGRDRGDCGSSKGSLRGHACGLAWPPPDPWLGGSYRHYRRQGLDPVRWHLPTGSRRIARRWHPSRGHCAWIPPAQRPPLHRLRRRRRDPHQRCHSRRGGGSAMSSMPAHDAQRLTRLAQLYRHLRVVDVCDALDGIGYFDLTLMSPEIRPLWLGMKIWGPAFTVRCVPANRPMWKLSSTEEIVDAHSLWFREVGYVGYHDQIRPGHVIVTDTGGAREVGFWGSANSLGLVERGAVGIVTDGYCRDTAEIALQKTPVCARARGRTIIPGRIEVVEAQAKIGCGGVQVRPGDIVGCDDDG